LMMIWHVSSLQFVVNWLRIDVADDDGKICLICWYPQRCCQMTSKLGRLLGRIGKFFLKC